MKFVQGDAIAGVFIILINIIGGLYIGISRGQAFSDAVQQYTILTVGDGLVSQLPALFISVCAGIVVTRVSSSQGATLATDVVAQLFSMPIAMLVTGVALILFGILTQLPWVPFVGVGLVLIIFALWQKAQVERGTKEQPRMESIGTPITALLPGSIEESRADETSIVLTLDDAVLYGKFSKESKQHVIFGNSFKANFDGYWIVYTMIFQLFLTNIYLISYELSIVEVV